MTKKDWMAMAKDIVAIEDEEKGIHTGRFGPVQRIPIPAKPSEVKAARHNLKVSQAAFANVIGVSLPTVKAWERGARRPDGVASRLIRLLRRNKDFASIWSNI
jgi:putative transcriptional regulator